MQQLGNMKDNFDDLSDPEQFACLVNARQFVFTCNNFYKFIKENFESQRHLSVFCGVHPVQ